MGIPIDIIPEAMEQHTILSLYPEQQHTGPNLLRLNLARPEAPGTTKPAVVTAIARITASELPLQPEQFNDLDNRIVSALEWAIPFIRRHIIWKHSPYVTLDPDTQSPRLDPSELQEVFGTPAEGCLDLSAVPASSAYKNVIYIGEHYLGALGLEGEFLAANQAFKWVAQRIRLKRLLGK
jgi:hypothetical protein